MVRRLLLASFRRRFRQLALILAAVAVAAATVATLAGFSTRAAERLGADLAAFGPNLTVRPQVGGPATIPFVALQRVREVPGVHAAQGRPPVMLASYGATSDRGLVERIEVRADSRRIAEIARAIEARVEGIEAVPLLRVSESDARLTRRLTLVLAAVSAVSFLLALLSVGAATTALIGERRAEIGLLLALGFTGRRVGALLAVELLAAAGLASACGELLGELAAGSLARRLLGSGGPALTWSGFSAAVLTALLVVGSSLLVALRRLERVEAARVLRGE